MRELVGAALGWMAAPVVGAGAFVRRARFFHPEGIVFRADVSAIATEEELGPVARRLEGPALVRVSTALWRGGKEWIDVLGFAVRFSSPGAPLGSEASPGDQDLLFATIRRPWTTLLAPLTTHTKSFLRNDYYAVSPFEVTGLRRGGRAQQGARVKWRLVAPPGLATQIREPGMDRAQELKAAAKLGLAVFRLEARRSPARLGSRWEPVAEITLREPLEIDQAALRFSPFRVGRGIRPRGLVHALRIGTYAMSQLARPAKS